MRLYDYFGLSPDKLIQRLKKSIKLKILLKRVPSSILEELDFIIFHHRRYFNLRFICRHPRKGLLQALKPLHLVQTCFGRLCTYALTLFLDAFHQKSTKTLICPKSYHTTGIFSKEHNDRLAASTNQSLI